MYLKMVGIISPDIDGTIRRAENYKMGVVGNPVENVQVGSRCWHRFVVTACG